LTSSAIGRTPQDSTDFQFLLQHVDQSGRTDFGFLRNRLAGDFPEKATEFVLDSELDRHYRTAVLSAVFERTLGRLLARRSAGDPCALHFDRAGPPRHARHHDGNGIFRQHTRSQPARQRPWRFRAGRPGRPTDAPNRPCRQSVGARLWGRTCRRDGHPVGHDSEPRRPVGVGHGAFVLERCVQVAGLRGVAAEPRATLRDRHLPVHGRNRVGTLTVSSDTPGSPQRVSVLGKGIGGIPTPMPDGPGL
jgi:hypothetical protein